MRDRTRRGPADTAGPDTPTPHPTPTASGSSAVMIPAPAGDALLPVVAAIVGEPHRGRRMPLVVVIDCCHCHGVHRHVTTAVRPSGLRRACPVTGHEYAILRVPPAKAVTR